MSDAIVNRVANSSLIQIELDEFAFETDIDGYDLAQNLFQGFVLKEKDFRDFIAQHNWSDYTKKCVAIFCSSDAIIPSWAYMLVASALQKEGASCHFGSIDEVRELLLLEKIRGLNIEPYMNKKVLIKGCGKFEASPEIYLQITRKLQPHVSSLMFGEACSTVPVYKKG